MDDYDAQVSQQFEDSPIAAGLCRANRTPNLKVNLHVDGQVLSRLVYAMAGSAGGPVASLFRQACDTFCRLRHAGDSSPLA